MIRMLTGRTDKPKIFDDKIELLLISFLGLIFMLLSIREIAEISVNQLFLLVVMALPIVMLPYKYLVYYTCFVSVLIKGVNAYILTLLLIGLVIKSKNRTILQFAPPILLLIFEFVANISELSVLTYVLYASYLILFFYLVFDDEPQVNPDKCLQYITYGLFVTLLFVSIGILKNPMDTIFLQEGASRGEMGIMDDENVTHFALNANELAYYSISLLSILLLGKRRINANNVIYVILFIASLLSGILSQSRAWAILTIFIFVLYFLQASTKKKISFVTIFVLILTFITSVSSDFLNLAYEGILYRFEDSSMNTAGGRTLLFEEYNKIFAGYPEYWVTGTGAMSYNTFFNASNSMHNGTQQIYICYGCVGILIYFFSAYAYYRRNIYNVHYGFVSYLPLIATACFVQSIQFLNPFHLMLPVALSTYAIRRRHEAQ